MQRIKQEEVICNICEEIKNKINKHKIESIGFKLWIGDGFEGAVKIAGNIKKSFPKIKIFGGGPQVDIFMGKILEDYKCFDALVYGEGEETIQRLAEYGANKKYYKYIPNLLFKENGEVIKTQEKIIDKLDDLPMPIYDSGIYPAMRGNNKIKIIVIDESRGCKNNCSFCIHPVKSGHSIRMKSIKRILKEVSIIKKRYNISAFRFAGSSTPYVLLNKFSKSIIKKKRKIFYTCFAHVREDEKANFEIIKESGCLALFFGVESGSQKILNMMRKGVKVKDISNTIKAAKRAGVYTVGSLIFPAPGEDKQTEKETINMLLDVKPDAIQVQSPIITPRTDWFDSPDKYSIKIKSKEKYLNQLLNWKVKFMFPTTFWDGLPISINGRNYRQILMETSNFVKGLKKKIISSVSDDIYMMSRIVDMKVEDFKDKSIEAFFTKDKDKILEIVKEINKKVKNIG